MKLREAWRISKVPYNELTYRSTVVTRGSARPGIGRSSDPTKRVKSIVRGALIGKVIFTFFVSLASGFTLTSYIFDKTPASLVGSVAFSLAITLAYMVLYSLQVLPSFSGAEPYSLLTTLPLESRELSMVALLSFVRTFDLIVIGAIVTQVTLVGYFSGSAAAALLMLTASVVNCTFGVAISLWLSGLFYRNINRGGRGKVAAVARLVFLVSWGFAAISIGFLFNFISYLIPLVNGAVTGSLSSPVVTFAFALVHPFTAGLVIASVVFPSFSLASRSLGDAVIVAYVAFVAYLSLGVLAARRTLSTVLFVAQGQTFAFVRQTAKEFLLRVRRPVSAYVLKDFRVASKSPSTAFIFALPLLETLIIALSLFGLSVVRATSVLTLTGIGSAIPILSAASLLNTEGSGLEYTLTLPLRSRVIIDAKSLVATVAYLAVPVAIGAFLLAGRPTSPYLFLIPVIQVISVSAGTSAALSFFIQSYKRAGSGATGSGSIETRGLSLLSGGDVVRLIEAFAVAGAIVLGPLAVYAGTFLLSHGHLLGILAMGCVAAAELLGVRLYLRGK